MPKQQDFESRLARALATYTTVVDTDFDQAAIARRAINPRRAWSSLMPSRAQIRLAQIAFALLLLVLALAAAALIASRPPDPGEMVRRSQAVHADPPPYTITMTAFAPPNSGASLNCSDSQADERIRYLFFYDGGDGFRFECLAEGNARGADFQVRRGENSGSFIRGEWHEPATGELLQQLGTVPYLTWARIRQADPRLGRAAVAERMDCPAWSFAGRETVAGRPAWHVSCGEQNYWIDALSSLLVKISIGDMLISEATALELGTPPEHLFEVAPPEDSRRYLVVGHMATGWELPLYGRPTSASAVVSSKSLTGRRTVVLFHNAQSCQSEPCFSIDDFTAVVGQHVDRIGSVIIAQGEYRETSVQQAAQAGIPMVADDGAVAPVWLADAGTVALLDESGRVYSLLSPTVDATRRHLSEVVDKFVSADEL